MARQAIQVYCVGGAVRDQLLNQPIKDRDWVVVGASVEEMLAQGYSPVGKDFPVFLHPETHEEYALARTERKTARGYKGFDIYTSPEVSLEQDLLRRDFTINAIALSAKGDIIDPYHGQQDLQAGILRHVSPAFSEDPVRILRGARFSARFDFKIADETQELMSFMVQNGEIDALVSERVWQELSRGLMESHPSLFFNVLRDCGALVKIMPELDALFGVPQPTQHHPEIDCGIHSLLTLDRAAAHNFDLATRFAALTHDLGKALSPTELLPRHTGHELRGISALQSLLQRMHLPNEVAELALLSCRYHGEVHRVFNFDATSIIRLLQETDAFRRPERFQQLLNVCICDAQGRTGHEQDQYLQANYLSQLLTQASSIDAGHIAKQCHEKKQIPVAIFQARVSAITQRVQQQQID